MIRRLAIILSLLVPPPTQAGDIDVSCELTHSSIYADPDDTDQLIIRRNSTNFRAVLISKYLTRTFDCVDAIVDEHECFGFHGKPGGAPTQLNISDTKPGSTVVSTTLNMIFLNEYAAGNYAANDWITRRFSIDTYKIKSCN